MTDTYLVSACLLGTPCRYDGAGCPSERVKAFLAGKGVVPVCPEELGGLPTPRRPTEIVGGDGADVLDGRARVLDAAGADSTAAMVRGAQAALAVAREHGARHAILKARSPSCGVGVIHDGSFAASLRPGSGVTASLLERSGIEVVADDQFEVHPAGGEV